MFQAALTGLNSGASFLRKGSSSCRDVPVSTITRACAGAARRGWKPCGGPSIRAPSPAHGGSSPTRYTWRLRTRKVRCVAMAWVVLVAAGLFETAFAVLLKVSDGMSRLWPTAGFAACALISFGLLTIALRELEVGPAYAVWTGIGAAGTAVVGMILLGDTVSAAKLVSISLVLAGVVGLNLSGVSP